MGKDLQGNELGIGLTQIERYGKKYYYFRKRSNGKVYDKRFKTLDDALSYKEDVEYYDGSIKVESKNINPDILGDVYFITDGIHVKIGHSINLKERMKRLQTANSNQLKLLFHIRTVDYIALENSFHKLFRKYLVNGEWYDILFLFDNRG